MITMAVLGGLLLAVGASVGNADPPEPPVTRVTIVGPGGTSPFSATVQETTEILVTQVSMFSALQTAPPADVEDLVHQQAVDVVNIVVPDPATVVNFNLRIATDNQGRITVVGQGEDSAGGAITVRQETGDLPLPAFDNARINGRAIDATTIRVVATVDGERSGPFFFPLPLTITIIPPFDIAATAVKLTSQLDEGGAATAAAAHALGNLGFHAAGAVEKLKQIMCNPDPTNPDVAHNAGSALGKIGLALGMLAGGADILDFLSDKLQDPNSNQEVKAAALAGLGDFGGGAIPAILDFLDTDPPAGLKVGAIVALGEAGPSQESIDRLQAIVLDPLQEEQCRREAANSLGKLGPAAVPALIMLLDTVTDNGSIRGAVITALGATKEPSTPFGLPASVAALIDVVQNGTAFEMVTAMDALVASGDRSNATIQAIIDKLVDPTEVFPGGITVSGGAQRALKEMGKVVLSLLQQAVVSHPSATVRAFAAMLLGMPELCDPSSRDALAAGVCDPDLSVRTAAAQALGNVLGGE